MPCSVTSQLDRHLHFVCASASPVACEGQSSGCRVLSCLMNFLSCLVCVCVCTHVVAECVYDFELNVCVCAHVVAECVCDF